MQHSFRGWGGGGVQSLVKGESKTSVVDKPGLKFFQDHYSEWVGKHVNFGSFSRGKRVISLGRIFVVT